MIKTFPISWLTKQVQDLDSFIEFFKPLFDNGGYVAGGFARSLLSSKEGVIEALTKLTYTSSDIDFYFKSPKELALSEKLIHNTFLNVTKRASFGMNAIEYFVNRRKAFSNLSLDTNIDWQSIKIQIIESFSGTPESIINAFDLANCQLAFDDKKVWVSEAFLQYELNNILHVENWHSKYITSRVAKYLLKKDYKISSETKVKILNYMLQSLIESPTLNDQWSKNITCIRNLITNSSAVKTEDISLFIGLLGVVDNLEYSPVLGTLGQDFAVAAIMHRSKNEQTI